MLTLGGASMDISTATGAMIFAVMAILAQMELEISARRRYGPPPTAASRGGTPVRSAAWPVVA